MCRRREESSGKRIIAVALAYAVRLNKAQNIKHVKGGGVDITKSKMGILITLLSVVVFLSFATAETDIAHRIWFEMAEEGSIDLSSAWEFMGMYTFGETTGAGYVTLPMTDDGSRISGSVSWRMYPESESDITERFFPMLTVLLSELCHEEDLTGLSGWLDTQEAVALLARYNSLPYQSDVQAQSGMSLYIKYDENHNELYCLITAEGIEGQAPAESRFIPNGK